MLTARNAQWFSKKRGPQKPKTISHRLSECCAPLTGETNPAVLAIRCRCRSLDPPEVFDRWPRGQRRARRRERDRSCHGHVDHSQTRDNSRLEPIRRASRNNHPPRTQFSGPTALELPPHETAEHLLDQAARASLRPPHQQRTCNRAGQTALRR